MNFNLTSVLILSALMASSASAASITAVNLENGVGFVNGVDDAFVNGVSVGEFVNGPVGTTVDSGFNSPDANFGGFSGGAANNGGVFTYIQTVTLGADNVLNDGEGTNTLPDGVINALGADFFLDNDTSGDPGSVNFYALNSVAAGFNGIAGYSFSDALIADSELAFDVSLTDIGGLQWDVTSGEWTTGETISFFFQSTQGPLNPTGSYQIGNDGFTATARGPLPTPLPTPVPLPASALLLFAALAGLGFAKRRA